jgi:CDP-diacylglycerol--serine O-phosphatidyltransferase
MRPRFFGEIGVADGVSVANAVLGFVAVLAALSWDAPAIAARVVLLAAVADGLDGVLARRYGSTAVGETLDSLSDVVSFGIAPAALLYTIAGGVGGISWPALLGGVVAAAFLAAGVVRLCLYTVEEAGTHETIGVPTTLAATVLAAAVLADVGPPALLLGAGTVFAYLMITDVVYPDLRDWDAITLGAVQVLAILVPTVGRRVFPRVLLVSALAYLVLGPRYYWGQDFSPVDSVP